LLYSHLPKVPRCNYSYISPRDKRKDHQYCQPRWPVFSRKSPFSATRGRGMILRSFQKNTSFLVGPGKLKSIWTADPLGWSSFTRRLSQNSSRQLQSWTGTGTRLSPSSRMFSRAATKLPGGRWCETTSPTRAPSSNPKRRSRLLSSCAHFCLHYS